MWLKESAVKTWEYGGHTFYLILRDIPGLKNYYCGYVCFPSRPVKETDYNGLLTYVQVHGGITPAEEMPDGAMIYGFDCAHAGDDDNPLLLDEGFLVKECQYMAQAIKIAAEFEDAYLLASTEEDKAVVIGEFHTECERKLGPPTSSDFSLGVMINLFTGKL